MAYTSTYTGAQIDSAVERALNPDNVAVQNSTRPYQSGAAYTKFASTDSAISDLQTSLTNLQNFQTILGTSDPTSATEGSIGQLFLNTFEPKLFICTSTLEGYTWLRIQLGNGIPYTTVAPTSANTEGLKIAVLTSEPATKYDGWLYLVTGE